MSDPPEASILMIIRRSLLCHVNLGHWPTNSTTINQHNSGVVTLQQERSNNDKVAKWIDINPQSSYKYQFVSTDPTYQPVYSDSGVNGLPSLVFNTSHMFLYNFQIGANYTFFMFLMLHQSILMDRQ